MPTITKNTFFQYLKCPSWVKHASESPEVLNSLRVRLQQDGLLKENLRTIIADRKFFEVEADDLEEGEIQTINAMRAGVPSIFGGTLIFDRLVAQPDLLERVEGKSNFGDYYYIACDVKRTKHLKEEYKIQGCFYAEVLKFVQGIKPKQGYLMRPNGEITSYLLEEIEEKYYLTLDGIERILHGEDEPHFLTSECKQSPWFSKCREAAIFNDDLSRINRIWRSEVKDLMAAGYDTISELAAAHPDRLGVVVTGISRERLEFLRAQAQALASGRHQILGKIDLPFDENYLVIDIESDPLRDLDYLFGVLVVDGDKTEYHCFVASKPEEEERAWKECLEFLRRYAGWRIYHYGYSEIDTFKHLLERYGGEPEIFQDLSERSVDLLIRLRESVIFPVSFYSLKDLAHFIGFNWRHPEASGLNSVLWYEEFLSTGDQGLLEDIVKYNEDDVLATERLIKWAKKAAV